MRALHARRHENVRTAFESGVPIFAGTDAGGVLPHGLVAREVLELIRAGVPAADAVGAGSWRARAYLLGGSGALTHGAVADLTVYAADPVAEPEVLLRPERIILRGRVVR